MNGFWQDRTVLVTGHTGFKGSWLSLWLQQLGARVVGVSLDPPTYPNLYTQARVAEGMTSLRADIRNGQAIREVFQKNQPQIVFHLAAQPLVRRSYHDPVETYATNVMGTVNLFEAIRQCPSVRAVVNVTSDKCYENKEWPWGYRENEPMGGYDPYSSSKGCSELVTSAYRQSFFNLQSYHEHGIAVATARAGNVIGGGDWATDRLICDCVRALLKQEEIVIRNPNAIRPWQHVLEPLSGYLLLAQRLIENGPDFAEAWNFGPAEADARPVEWMVQRMCALWGEGATYRVDHGEHPHEATYLKLDCSKARSLLGWQPKWHLEQALKNIISWTRGFENQEDIRSHCLAQIAEHQKTGCTE
jgi:CDP-glucose 4,6-dehydratase